MRSRDSSPSAGDGAGARCRPIAPYVPDEEGGRESVSNSLN